MDLHDRLELPPDIAEVEPVAGGALLECQQRPDHHEVVLHAVVGFAYHVAEALLAATDIGDIADRPEHRHRCTGRVELESSPSVDPARFSGPLVHDHILPIEELAVSDDPLLEVPTHAIAMIGVDEIEPALHVGGILSADAEDRVELPGVGPPPAGNVEHVVTEVRHLLRLREDRLAPGELIDRRAAFRDIGGDADDRLNRTVGGEDRRVGDQGAELAAVASPDREVPGPRLPASECLHHLPRLGAGHVGHGHLGDVAAAHILRLPSVHLGCRPVPVADRPVGVRDDHPFADRIQDLGLPADHVTDAGRLPMPAHGVVHRFQENVPAAVTHNPGHVRDRSDSFGNVLSTVGGDENHGHIAFVQYATHGLDPRGGAVGVTPGIDVHNNQIDGAVSGAIGHVVGEARAGDRTDPVAGPGEDRVHGRSGTGGGVGDDNENCTRRVRCHGSPFCQFQCRSRRRGCPCPEGTTRPFECENCYNSDRGTPGTCRRAGIARQPA